MFLLVPRFVFSVKKITRAQDGPYLVSVVYCELEAHEGDQVGHNFGFHLLLLEVPLLCKGLGFSWKVGKKHVEMNRTEFQIQMGLDSNLSLLLQDSMARIRRLKFEFKPLDLLA